MMFNGKGKVCYISDVMYIGEDARVIEEVVDLFAETGRDGAINTLLSSQVSTYGGILAKVPSDRIIAESLEKESIKKRKEFRGIHIGDLT